MKNKKERFPTQLQVLLKECESKIINKLSSVDNQMLRELFLYHLKSGGERNRAKLAIFAGNALNLPNFKTLNIASSCEMIHNASLLHDDIQDGDTHRRGREAAWSLYGINNAMCGGTIMLSAAYALIAQIEEYTAELVQHMHERIANLISGQIADLSHDNQKSSIDNYINIATQKSGSLLSLPLELIMIASCNYSSVTVARKAGESFAIAYQIFDDLRDQHNDLINENCNILFLLEATGLNFQNAKLQAISLAKTHLQKAIKQSQLLPNSSGQLLIDMCHELSEALLSFNPQESI